MSDDLGTKKSADPFGDDFDFDIPVEGKRNIGPKPSPKRISHDTNSIISRAKKAVVKPKLDFDHLATEEPQEYTQIVIIPFVDSNKISLYESQIDTDNQTRASFLDDTGKILV